MTDRYERIREALAMGPTPGPWAPKELPRDMQRDGYRFSISRGGLGWWIAKVTHEANGGSGAANAALIAACDPGTIRVLLNERDALVAENARLEEMLRELEDREQRDEALLRQALEALIEQRREPDYQTGSAREAAIAALRERLGEGERQ